MSEGTMVAWILIPAFLFVGFYLLMYSKRRRQMMDTFARQNQLSMAPRKKDALQFILDNSFALDGGMVRSFSQLSSIVDGRGVWLFRTVEILDINPHGQASTTHLGRIVALFDVISSEECFFLLSSSGQFLQRLPSQYSPSPATLKTVMRAAQACSVKHTLSVSLSRGRGLIYFEPHVVGSETQRDVETLFALAKLIQKRLL